MFRCPFCGVVNAARASERHRAPRQLSAETFSLEVLSRNSELELAASACVCVLSPKMFFHDICGLDFCSVSTAQLYTLCGKDL